jgi:hypothetical protein
MARNEQYMIQQNLDTPVGCMSRALDTREDLMRLLFIWK